MQEKKSYYAIIPANVRYDSDLIPSAKLLYGEITALCNEQGFCWASNKYFADLYETNERTIRRWLESLAEKKHISVIPTSPTTREIYIVKVGQKSPERRAEMSVKGGQKRPHNNTVNTTENNIMLFEKFWSEYPNRKRDKEKCQAKFLSFKPDLQEKIVADVIDRKVRHSDWVKNKYQFVPAPLVYLRNKRWEEEIDGKGISGNVFHNNTGPNKSVEKIKEKMKANVI